MSAPHSEKTTFGASIEPPTHLQPTLQTNNLSTDAVSTYSSIATPSTPPALRHQEGSNPFASIPTTPLDENKNAHLQVRDLEGQHVPLSAATTVLQVSEDGRVKECKMSMWPSKQSLIADAKASKRQRRWRYDPMRNLNKRQKIIAKVIIALLVVGLVAGLGVGITRAVGGGVWSGRGSNRQIPGTEQRAS